MGKGRDFTYTKNITNVLKDANWVYPAQNSTDYIKFSFICDQP